MVAIEIAAEQKLYPWRPQRQDLGFESLTLFDRPFETVSHREQQIAVRRALGDVHPSAVVMAGYRDPVMRAAAYWARQKGRGCVMTTPTTRRDHRRFWPLEMLKGWWCKRYYNALFLSGERSVAYFRGLGFPEDRIWRGTDVVDNEHFALGADRIRRRAAEHRKRLDLPERYFLTVCRLSPEKNVAKLLRAFAAYRKAGGLWDLVVVGSGPLEARLKNAALSLGLSRACFAGWEGYDELPAYYALACCFILPSLSEPWGLVVNEAMACGLPVLVSRNCGCVPELCHRGVNGWDFAAEDEEGLARLMLRVSSGELDLESMGAASGRIIANFTPETWARSLAGCIEDSSG